MGEPARDYWADDIPQHDTLPHDDYAERVLIGSILLEPERLGEASSLTAEAFYSKKHQALFRGIVKAISIAGMPDLGAVVSVLRDDERLADAGGVEYIASLHGGAWKAAQIGWYSKRLMALGLRREAISSAESIGHIAATEDVGATREALGALMGRLDQATAEDTGLHAIDPYEALTGEIEPIPWMIPGWFSKGERIIIGGEWSSGKSVVALEAAIALATCGAFLGVQTTGGPYRVLYVDEENGSALARKRMRQLQKGRDLSPEASKAMPLRYLSKNAISFSTDKGCAQFRREVEAFKPDIVVLDSVIRFFSGESENDNSQWAAFMAAHIMPLNAQGISFVLLDHVRKPANGNNKHGDEDIGQRIRGASDKPGSVDEVWCIAGDRHTNKRTMTHERTRWDEYQPAMQLAWTTSEDKESAVLEATPEKQGCEDLILSHLNRKGAEGMLRKDLLDVLSAAGFQTRSVEKALTSIYVKGQAKKAKDHGKAIRLWARFHAPPEAE